jgi:hypothetical protein
MNKLKADIDTIDLADILKESKNKHSKYIKKLSI